MATFLLAALVSAIAPASPAVAASDPVTAVAADPQGGAWAATRWGNVLPAGGAPLYGSLAGVRLSQPIVGITATPDGGGYWLVASDGGVFSFGDAAFLGSTGGIALVRPIVAMAATPDGHGYWLVASDGGVFSFGDARFSGSAAGIPLNAPIIGIAPAPAGYWLVASDGGVFAFGGAPFVGSLGNLHLNAPIVALASPPGAHGYWLVASDGGVFAMGMPFFGSLAGSGAPVVGAAATPDGAGYWLASPAGGLTPLGSAARVSPLVGGPPAASPAVPAAGAASPTPALPGSPVHLVFDDEFNGPSLSPTWSTCWWYSLGGCSNGDSEGEWYQPQNVSLSGGNLALTARNQPALGKLMSTGAPRTYNYTSGMVTSEGKFSFSYGYVEWRAQIPKGQGFWPALWLMPQNNTWPPELDVLEVVSNQTDIGNFTWHPPTGGQQGHYTKFPFDLSAGYHTYGADWEPDHITWYVDGQAVATSAGPIDGRAMYLVMNLAVGGGWPGYPDATTPFPSSFNIDYVRVWQH